jgi:hypothetical protein
MTHLLDRNLPSWGIQDATKLTAFCACPRKYFWEYVLGWRPEAPSNHLVFGQAWHSAQEYLLLHDYSIDSIQKAHEVFLETYRKILPPETDDIFFPKTPDNALLALARYVGKYREDHSTYNVLYTEISGKVTVGENRFMHFRMDSILEKKNTGQIISIDHKTGSRTWGWEIQFPLSHQTGTYTHVLYCMYPKELVRGVSYRGTFFGHTKKAWEQIARGANLTYKDPVEFIEYPAFRSTEQMQSWLWHVNYWLDQVDFQFKLLADCKEEDPVMYAFPQNPTSCSNYGGCTYADFCNAWMNPLQRCSEPPLNYVESHWDPSKEVAKHVFNL